MTAAQAPSTRGGDAVERRALSSIVREELPLGTETAADIAFDVCDALASLHANGIVHGDLGLNRIRVAWPRGEDRGIEIFAREEDTVGRPSGFYTAPTRFMAPEQRRANATVDMRADIWAVGALLRVLLEGARRPQMMNDLVDACLADDPVFRPQTIREVSERLATFSAWPPACFERIAARKQADDDAKSALGRSEAQDGLGALERLEQRAIDREREGLKTPLPGPLKNEIVLGRLVSVVVEQTGSPPPDVAPPPVIDIADDDLSVTLDDADVDEALEAAIAIDDDYDDLLPTIAHPSSSPDVYKLASDTEPTPPVVVTERVPPVRTEPLPPVKPSPRVRASVVVAEAASVVPSVRASQPSLPAARASSPSLPFTARTSSARWPAAPQAAAPPSSPVTSPLSVSHPPSSRTAALIAPPTSSAQLPSASPPASERDLDTVRRRKRARAAAPWIAVGVGALAISAVGVFATWTYFAHRATTATATATAIEAVTATPPPEATAPAAATATATAITPESLPDVHITPSALPDAPMIHRAAPAPVVRKPAAADDADEASAKPTAPPTADKPAADAPPATTKAKADAPKKPASKDDEFE